MAMPDRKTKLSNYPLCWPDGWPRTARVDQKYGHFKSYGYPVTIAKAIERILNNLGMMGIRRDDVLISTNVATRLDGLPRSDQPKPVDAGAAAYWRKGQDGPMQCMAIDIYVEVESNLCAIAATIEAMRAIERHGGAQIQERAFRGFAALPASTSRPWRDVLQVRHIEHHPDPLRLIESQFKTLAAIYHPDKPGGSDEAMSELNKARDEARAELRRGNG